MNRISHIVFVLIFLAGCSSRTVNFDYDQEADFTTFKTYDWYENDQMVADEAPLAHQRVIAAIDRQMEAKGFQKASSNPDVYVTYYASDRENTVVDTTHYGYGYGAGWRWGGMGGMGMSSSTSTVRNYTTGTLVVDLWDANAGPVGGIIGFSLQQSTVDVARELTDLIQTQRAYSSNATTIRTVDEMLV